MSDIGKALVGADRSPVRRHVLDAVLVDTMAFNERMQDLTLKEVYAAFKLELATHQRSYVLDRLARRAKALAAKEVGEFFNTVKQGATNG